MAVIGDITHSRVANSIKEALGMLGGEVAFSGPDELGRKGMPITSVWMRQYNGRMLL